MANGIIGKVTAGGGTHLVTSTFYGTCATAANTAAKIVKLADATPDSATLITGMTLAVKFTYSNTVANPTLTVQRNANTTNLIAAKSIKRYGTTAPGTTAQTSWRAGAVVLFIYDGTNWVMVSSLDDDTTYTSKTAASGGTDTSLVTTGEKYIWNNKSDLTIGTTATTAAAGNHNHDDDYVNIAGDSMTGRLTMTSGKPINQILTGTGTAGKDNGASDTSTRYQPAKWTFNTGLTLVDGDIFTIKIPVAGHSYGVYMSIDNGTTYKPIVCNSTGKLTTHYVANSYIQVIYEPTGSAASIYPLNGGMETTTVSNGVFRVINYYDANTNTLLRTYSSATNIDVPLIAQNSAASTTATWSTYTGTYKDWYGAIPNDDSKRAKINLNTGIITVPGGITASVFNNSIKIQTIKAWGKTGPYEEGWTRVCTLTGFQGYGVGRVYINGSWSSEESTIAAFEISFSNTQYAHIKQVLGARKTTPDKVRMVYSGTGGTWYFDIHIPARTASSATGDRYVTFVGKFTISNPDETTNYITTEPTTLTVVRDIIVTNDQPTITVNLNSTTVGAFTGADMTTGISGTLGIGNGGTGATSVANALTNLGISATSSSVTVNGTTFNKYTHPTTAGNKHIPTNGASGNILIYGGSSGTATWGSIGSHSYTKPTGATSRTADVALNTTTVNSITAVGTLPSLTVTNTNVVISGSVVNEVLSFNTTSIGSASGWSAGTLPTKGSNTTVATTVKTQPTFTVATTTDTLSHTVS